MDRPETLYAWNGEVALAYQVVGDGPIDLVYLQGYCSNIDRAGRAPISRGSFGGWPGSVD